LTPKRIIGSEIIIAAFKKPPGKRAKRGATLFVLLPAHLRNSTKTRRNSESTGTGRTKAADHRPAGAGEILAGVKRCQFLRFAEEERGCF